MSVRFAESVATVVALAATILVAAATTNALATALAAGIGSVAVLGVGAWARAQSQASMAPLPAETRATDALTGLTNRAAAVATLEKDLAHREAGRAVAVLIDIDRFRSVNDRHGIPAGDRVLREVARRLSALARPNQFVARVGGDEFLVTSTATTRAEAHSLGDQIVAVLAEPFDVGHTHISVHASIGLSDADIADTTSNQLLRDVDLAVLEAKTHAGTFLVHCDDKLRSAAVERLEIEAELQTALEAGEIELWLQPIVDALTHETVSAEVLLRWERLGAASIKPGAFIPVAEIIDLIIPITIFTLDATAETGARWHAAGVTTPLAVNVSASHIIHGDLERDVREALQRHGTPAEMIEIEITETRLAEDFDLIDPVLQRLRAMGCHIAIDDFGTGYSSVRYLQRIPADRVKLDRDIVHDVLAGDPRGEALLMLVTELSHALGMEVVAEGVETVDQLAAINAAEVDYAQGFLFASPMPVADFEAIHLA